MIAKLKFFLPFFFIFLVTIGQGCLKGGNKQAKNAYKSVELNYWRVYDSLETFQPLFAQYQAMHPNVTINYRQLRYDEYERELLNALAEDRGPDILAIHNTWVRAYKTKLLPLPAKTVLPTPVIKGSIKKETVIEIKTEPSITPRLIKNSFIDQVAKDVIVTEPAAPETPPVERIYGLPLGVDTLVMFYNRNLFNNAGIALAPTNWSQFQETVKKLTRLDSNGNILLSGAAIGGSANVVRSTDILSILMMQNGADMTRGNTVAFHYEPEGGKRGSVPGAEALIFYTDFANPTKEVYSWNSQMPNSLEAFVNGQTAIFFGYSFHLPVIKARAPKLNLGIAKLPQIDGNPEVNFANYWVEAVSRKSKNPDFAWNLIQFLTSPSNVKKHLDLAKKPASLRSLIDGQLQQDDLTIFASQLLTAKSWYQGANPNAADRIFGEMIDQVLAGAGELGDIMDLAAGRLNQTLP